MRKSALQALSFSLDWETPIRRRRTPNARFGSQAAKWPRHLTPAPPLTPDIEDTTQARAGAADAYRLPRAHRRQRHRRVAGPLRSGPGRARGRDVPVHFRPNLIAISVCIHTDCRASAVRSHWPIPDQSGNVEASVVWGRV